MLECIGQKQTSVAARQVRRRGPCVPAHDKCRDHPGITAPASILGKGETSYCALMRVAWDVELRVTITF
jgi:hypothetical protein